MKIDSLASTFLITVPGETISEEKWNIWRFWRIRCIKHFNIIFFLRIRYIKIKLLKNYPTRHPWLFQKISIKISFHFERSWNYCICQTEVLLIFFSEILQEWSRRLKIGNKHLLYLDQRFKTVFCLVNITRHAITSTLRFSFDLRNKLHFCFVISVIRYISQVYNM